MKSIWNKEPVMVSQIAGLIVSAGAIFGWKLSLEEAAALVTAVQVVVSLIARSKVSPTT